MPHHLNVRRNLAHVDRLLLGAVWLLLFVSAIVAPQLMTEDVVRWISLPLTLLTTLAVILRPGRTFTRLWVSAVLMTFASILIYQAHGDTEWHFGIFVLMSFLLAYRDWRTILVATLVIALQHYTMDALQLAGLNVFCFTHPGLRTVALHSAYVLVQAAFLIYLSTRMNAEARDGQDLATLSATLSRHAGKFDLRVPASDIRGRSSGLFKGTLDALHTTMQAIAFNIDQVALSSSDIATGNTGLALRIHTQSAALQTTTQNIADIASKVQRTSELTVDAEKVAKSSAINAAQSNAMFNEVIRKMGDVDTAVRNMDDLIGAIENIAFQTNLLALNAAVEAARAGSEGRGFAVVAGEVRVLAQRSSEAAKKTKECISAALGQVEESLGLVNSAGVAIGQVSTEVTTVAGLIEHITATSYEQSGDVERFRRAVEEVQQMIQRDVANVQNVANASSKLNEETQNLRTALSIFLVDAAEDNQSRLCLEA